MKLFLGLLENSLPDETRIFAEIDQKFVDLNMAYVAYFAASEHPRTAAYALAALYFPKTIAEFLQRGDGAQEIFAGVLKFIRSTGSDPRGPNGERILYNSAEVRILPPFLHPEKSFVIGFSDRARTEALPHAEIPTAFYKLPQSFVADGAPIVWRKFSEGLDADACLALVIGKPGRRIPAEAAWDHIGGITLLIDITARDVNRREGLTTNNLLGKNFPSSIAPISICWPRKKNSVSKKSLNARSAPALIPCSWSSPVAIIGKSNPMKTVTRPVCPRTLHIRGQKIN